jgi:hypothetical protein
LRNLPLDRQRHGAAQQVDPPQQAWQVVPQGKSRHILVRDRLDGADAVHHHIHPRNKQRDRPGHAPRTKDGVTTCEMICDRWSMELSATDISALKPGRTSGKTALHEAPPELPRRKTGKPAQSWERCPVVRFTPVRRDAAP